MASWEKFSRIVAEAKAAKKLDPVGHEDDDVDNDGDSDSSDSYLRRRRASVGAAIAADKKRKVEEAKQLDPVGKEDDDIDNDGDSDRTDSYLRNRRKVRSKIIQTKEEVEPINEFLGTGRVVAGRSQAGVNPGSRFTQAGTVQKVFGVTVPGSFEKGVSQSAVQRHNQKAAPGSQIKSTNQSMNQLLGRERGGQTTVGITPDKKPAAAAPKPQPTQQQGNYGNVGSLGNVGGNLKFYLDKKAEYNQKLNQVRQNNSYEPEGDQIDEVLGGQSGDGYIGHPRLGFKNPLVKKQTSTTTSSNTGIAGRLGNRASQMDAARQQLRQSYEPEGDLVDEGKADKKLPEHKRSAARLARYDNPSGALALGGGQQRARRAEHEERRGVKKEELELLDEMPYQVYGSPDGKSEKKIGKLVKSKKYAHGRAEELADTHKETGGKYRVQKEERVDEDREYRREMAKAAARERAEERKEKGGKAPKLPGREGPSVGKSYADHEELSIKGHDKVTKKAKITPGNPFPEHVEYEIEKGYIEEKSLSRAQQRFMGMVYAAKKGETPASPEVAKAASGMSKKAARDFAKTKHEGLPEKKEEVKEEMSLVERILAEVTDAEMMAAKARREDREKKQSKRLKRAKLSVAANKVLKGEDEDEQKSKTKRGKSAPTGVERAATVAAAGRVKSAEKEGKYKVEAEKIKSERQRERFAREEEKNKRKAAEREEKAKERQQDLESKQKEKKIKAAQLESDRKTARKEKTKDEIKGALKSAAKSVKFPSPVSDREKGSTGKTIDQFGDTIGSVVGAVGKAGRGILAAKMKERKEKKQEQERQQRHEKIRKGMSEDIFSNWREEFIFEVDDQSVQNEKQKVIDVSKKKNKIEINPNMSEECGCDEKEKETPKKDMRDLPTKVNLAKTKMRSMGVKNPVVMVTSEENIQEIAPLVGVLARVAGGAAARGIASRVAGGAAQGTLRSKGAELLGKKAGQMTAQAVQDKLTPQFKDEAETDPEPYMTDLEKKLRKEDWQSVNRKDKTDGLSQKAVNAYRSENPGSKLQTAVTEKNPEGKRAARRKSFCSRMSGMKKRLTSAETARDPDSRINKALRRWNCN